METDSRIDTYIRSLKPQNSDFLVRLRKESEDEHIPIIREETEDFLKTILTITHPKKVLELGCAIGYSAIFMSEHLPKGSSITTIENYEKRIPVAKKNISLAGKDDIITLIEGDAMDVMPTLSCAFFDFVFMDAAKSQYVYFLPEVARLLTDGGVLVADNIFQDGEVLKTHYAVKRRNRTIHKRMREYLEEITGNPLFTTSIVPVGDGLTLSVKNQKFGNY